MFGLCFSLMALPLVSFFPPTWSWKTINNICHYINIVTVAPQLSVRAVLRFSSVQSLSHVRLFVTPWIEACQASLSITNSWSSTKLMCIESVMPSSHLILCRPLLLLPPISPSIRVFSSESTLRMRWPKSLSRVRLFVTPWTAAYQAPPSMGFSRQKHWSGVPLPSLAESIRGSKKPLDESERGE